MGQAGDYYLGFNGLANRGPDDGPVVVLVHGYPDNRTVWDLVVADLERDHRVATYDVRGAGESTAPASRSGYKLNRLVDDLLEVSRITRGIIEVKKEPLDLAAIDVELQHPEEARAEAELVIGAVAADLGDIIIILVAPIDRAFGLRRGQLIIHSVDEVVAAEGQPRPAAPRARTRS